MTQTINQAFLDQLVDELDRRGIDLDSESDVRTDYSGRGMYGESCLGFVVDDPYRFVFALGGALEQVAQEDPSWEGIDTEVWFDGLRTDSMGRSQIVYFQRVIYDND